MRLRRFCSHMKDAEIAKLNRAAQSGRHGTVFQSHTEVYRNDPAYQAQQKAKTPPTPEWLVYTSGEVARLDGEAGSQY